MFILVVLYMIYKGWMKSLMVRFDKVKLDNSVLDGGWRVEEYFFRV